MHENFICFQNAHNSTTFKNFIEDLFVSFFFYNCPRSSRDAILTKSSFFSGLIEDEESRMYIEPYPAKVCEEFYNLETVSLGFCH